MPTVPELLYELEHAESLTSPTWIGLTNRLGTGEVIVLTDPVAAVAQRFYRVQVKPAPP